MSTEWLDIPGFEGKYQISSEGRIRAVYLLQDDIRVILTDKNKKRHNIKVEEIFKNVFK